MENNKQIVPVRSEADQQGLNIVTLGCVLPYLCFAQLCDLLYEFLCNDTLLGDIICAMRDVSEVVLPCEHLTRRGLEHVFGGGRFHNKKSRFLVEQNMWGLGPDNLDYRGLNIYHLEYTHQAFPIFNYSLLEKIELYNYPELSEISQLFLGSFNLRPLTLRYCGVDFVNDFEFPQLKCFSWMCSAIEHIDTPAWLNRFPHNHLNTEQDDEGLNFFTMFAETDTFPVLTNLRIEIPYDNPNQFERFVKTIPNHT